MKFLLHLVLLVYILNNGGYTSSNIHYFSDKDCTEIIKYNYYSTGPNTYLTIGRNIMLSNISSNIDVYSHNKRPLIFVDFYTEESNAYLNNDSGRDLAVIQGIPKHKQNFTKYEIRQRKPN